VGKRMVVLSCGLTQSAPKSTGNAPNATLCPHAVYEMSWQCVLDVIVLEHARGLALDRMAQLVVPLQGRARRAPRDPQ